jgi:hypothetical protein
VNGESFTFQLSSLDSQYLYSEAKAFCLAHVYKPSMSEEALENGCTKVIFNNLILKINESRTAAESSAMNNANSQASSDSMESSTVYQVKL